MDKLINGKGLQQFNYKNKLIAKRMFECMKNIQFRGVSVNKFIFIFLENFFNLKGPSNV